MEERHGARGSAQASGTEGGRSPSGEPEAWEAGESGLSGELEQTIAGLPKVRGKSRQRLLRHRQTEHTRQLNGAQRLLLLETYHKSGLPAGDFAAMVGVSRHTLYRWSKMYREDGADAFLRPHHMREENPPLNELTRRTILLIKQSHPDYGCQRISDILKRGPGLQASAGSIAKVLHRAGYQDTSLPTVPHKPKIRRFEREHSNQLWQTDLFTFVLKRQNRRVYMVLFIDDYSRYVVGWSLHASQSTALVIEAFRSAIASYQAPAEILTDNGSQYITWRGKGAFSKECEKRGIKQIVARPRRPETLGKVERFWGTLWRELLSSAIFADLGEARERIGKFIDFYNFQRPHQGIDGLVPADRYFGAESEMRKTLAARVEANSLSIAQNGRPQEPFYLAGNVGGKAVSVHAEGDRIIVTGEGVAPKTVSLESEKTGQSESNNYNYQDKETEHGGSEPTSKPEYTPEACAHNAAEEHADTWQSGSAPASGGGAGSTGGQPAGAGSLHRAEPLGHGLLSPGSAGPLRPGGGVRAALERQTGGPEAEDSGASAAYPSPGAGSLTLSEPGACDAARSGDPHRACQTPQERQPQTEQAQSTDAAGPETGGRPQSTEAGRAGGIDWSKIIIR